MGEPSKELRVVIIGLGGVGGLLADHMAKMLAFRNPGSMLIMVDGDFYEPKNRERQSFSQYGNKADVKAAEIAPAYPECYAVSEPKWVVEALDEDDFDSMTKIAVTSLVTEGSIVFATVDNNATRKSVFDAATKCDNIDVFTGGNDEALFGSSYHYQRRNGKDVTDPPSEWHEEYINPPDRNPGQLSCAERAELEGGTQFIATNAAVAALLAGRYQHCILDGKEDTVGEIHFDLGLGAASGYDRRVDPAEVAAALVAAAS